MNAGHRVKTSLVAMQKVIGNAVTAARKRERLTQQKLAQMMKTQQANISRIERGMQNLSLDLLIRLDRALGLGLKITVR